MADNELQSKQTEKDNNVHFPLKALVMETKPRVLNLYAGIGGNRKLWENVDVTAVELDEETAKVYQDYFPDDEVIVGDAHDFLLSNYKDFDFIWTSPPCPTHSDIRRCGVHRGQCEALYPDMNLYQEIIFLQNFAPKETRWVVENVIPYYTPLIPETKKLHRHLFWSNFRIGNFDNLMKRTNHDRISDGSTVYGISLKGTDVADKRKTLRNMVDPKLGEHIFNTAMKLKYRPKKEQGALFV